MSDFKFYCPRCRQRLKCDEQLAGRSVICPTCRHPLVIPSPKRLSRPEAEAGNGRTDGPRFKDPPPASGP